MKLTEYGIAMRAGESIDVDNYWYVAVSGNGCVGCDFDCKKMVGYCAKIDCTEHNIVLMKVKK